MENGNPLFSKKIGTITGTRVFISADIKWNSHSDSTRHINIEHLTSSKWYTGQRLILATTSSSHNITRDILEVDTFLPEAWKFSL